MRVVRLILGQRDGANGTHTLVVHYTKRKVGSARSLTQTKGSFARISAVAYRPLRNASEQNRFVDWWTAAQDASL